MSSGPRLVTGVVLLIAAGVLYAVAPPGAWWNAILAVCTIGGFLLSGLSLFVGRQRFLAWLRDCSEWLQQNRAVRTIGQISGTPLSAAEVIDGGLVRVYGPQEVTVQALAEAFEQRRAYLPLHRHLAWGQWHATRYVMTQLLLSVNPQGIPPPITEMCRWLARGLQGNALIDRVVCFGGPSNRLFAPEIARITGSTVAEYKCKYGPGTHVQIVVPVTDLVVRPPGGQRVIVAECLAVEEVELSHLIAHLRDEERAEVVGVAILFDGSRSEQLLAIQEGGIRVRRAASVDLGARRTPCCRSAVAFDYQNY